MNIKGWAEWKEPGMAKRDEQLKNIYLSAKMMKYHPLMTKELRKSYSLLAAAAMRAMSPEFKYGVMKLFNQMSTTLKAMRAAEISQSKVWTIQQKSSLWQIDFWSKLIELPIDDPNVPAMLAGYDPNVLMGNENYEYCGIIGECEDYTMTLTRLLWM